MIHASKEIAFQAMMDFVIIGFLFLAIAQGPQYKGTFSSMGRIYRAGLPTVTFIKLPTIHTAVPPFL